MSGFVPAISIGCMLTGIASFGSSVRVGLAGTSSAMTGLESQSFGRLVLGRTNPPIGQALAGHPFDGLFGAIGVASVSRQTWMPFARGRLSRRHEGGKVGLFVTHHAVG